jgi:hypothetical protein
MNRRRFLLAAAGAAGGVAAVMYAPLVPGREFEQFVAGKLGIGEELAVAMLERARSYYGTAEYDLRAAAFAVAFRGPVAALVPDGAQRRAVESLIEPMFSTQAAGLAYAQDDPVPIIEACSGLIPVR